MITRVLWRNYRLSSALKHRFVRRFTPAGVLVLAAMLVTGGIGVDTNQAVAYQAFNLLGIVVAISLLWSLGPKPLFLAERVLPRVGTAGQALIYQVRVVNLSRAIQASISLKEDLGDPRPTYEEFSGTPEPGESERNLFDRFFRFYRWMWLVSRKQIARAEEQKLPALLPHKEIEMQMQMTPRRRGQLHLRGLEFGVPDPFGLTRRYREVKTAASVLVLPKRYEVPAIDLPGTLEYQPGGVNLATSFGESEEFVSLREYRRGDPLRHIHWKSVGKTGKFIVKEFQNEFFVRHALILDTFLERPDETLFEEAVSVAASFACTLNTQESLLDLLFAGPKAYCLTGGHGVSQVEHMLEVLAGVQPCSAQSFSTLHNLVLERAAIVSGCICLFLHWNEARQRLVEQLRMLEVPLLVIVLKPAGGEDPDPGVMREDPRHFRVIEVGKAQEGLSGL